jgi:hypothetical protein
MPRRQIGALNGKSEAFGGGRWWRGLMAAPLIDDGYEFAF